MKFIYLLTIMIRLFIHLTLILFLSSHCLSQNWEKRHKFAKTYFGTNNYCVFGLTEGIYIDSEGNLKSFTKNNFISPAINIGATHFWGYADFYVSINTVGLKFKEDEVQNSFRLGTLQGYGYILGLQQKNQSDPMQVINFHLSVTVRKILLAIDFQLLK